MLDSLLLYNIFSEIKKNIDFMVNDGNRLMKQEIPWIHLVRVLACIMVVCLHVCSAANSYPKDNFDAAFLNSIYYATKPCVPLFFIVTGYLILPYKSGDNIMSFYKKRISRIFFPLITWGIIYSILPFFLGLNNIHDTIKELVLSPIKAPDQVGGILWYLFILIGIYLVIPFFSERIYDNKTFLRIYLLIWGGYYYYSYIKKLLLAESRSFRTMSLSSQF